MKKKLIAILLTLCMVLGMLPMSAFAAWYNKDGERVTVTQSETVDANGYYYTLDVDGTKYYTTVKLVEGDNIDYYTYYQDEGLKHAGTLTWKADDPKPETVTITFTGEGVTSSTVELKKGAAIGDKLPTAPTRDGYTFDGWFINGTVKVTATTTFTEDTTVTAKWTKIDTDPKEYDVTVTASPAQGGKPTLGKAKAKAGELVEIHTNPSKGWEVKSVTAKTAGGKTVDVDAFDYYNYYLLMPAESVAVTVVYKELPPAQVEVQPDDLKPDENGGATVEVTDKDLGESNTAEVKLPETIPEDVKEITIKTPVGEVTLDAEDAKGATVAVSGKSDAAPNGSVAVKTDVDKPLNITAPAPEGAKDGDTIWIVPILDDGSYGEPIKATVSKGKVTFAGMTNTVYAPMTEKQAQDNNVTVPSKPVTGVTLDKTEATLKKGETLQLTATVEPADADNKNLTWTTSDDKVATVDQTGKVTAVAKGEATITVTTANGLSATCKITVTETSGGGSGGGGGGGGGGSAISHSVTVGNTKNGSVRVNSSDAVKGEKVTITVRPSDGYVLDALTVKDANGKEVTLTKVDDTTYTFIMPETKVTVDATFKAAGAADEDEGFTDVAKDSTFYGDIAWAADKGYMTGYSDGTFRPDAGTTRQVLWMVLARMDGADPADMAAARTWAMEKKISDGTNPTNPVTRQQMVAMLYRYAQLKGYKLDGGKSLDTFSDAASVADYAKDAMSWAVGNGIVQGTASGTLNPTGAAIRAHFAAFLHRFCQTAGIA